MASSSAAMLPATEELYASLEDAAHGVGVSSADLEEDLEASSDFLSGCLGSYRPPSAASKAAVESGSVSYGGHTLQLNESIRKVTVAASAKLALDEVQTYALLRRCVDESGSPLPTELDDDLTERLTRYYFRERLGSLQCIQALVRAANDESDARGAPMRSCLDRLLRQGLEENLTSDLCSHMRGETPARPVTLSSTSPALARDWARQALEETQRMLECVFLMYYDQRTKCEAKRFAQLATAFASGALGRAPAAAAEFVRLSALIEGESGEAAALSHVRSHSETARALCTVILVEALDLEGAVERIQSPLGQGRGGATGVHAMLSEEALTIAAGALADWPSDAAHGPVLLAWATLLALAPAAGRPAPRFPAAADPAAAASRAAAGSAGFGSLLALLHLDAFKVGGVVNDAVTAHKSVLKNLLTSSLAAFDLLPVHKLRPEELGTLIDVLEELSSGEPMLCEQFWDMAQSDGQEAPLYALLVGCRERHPADAAPLLRALAALAEGPRAARAALAFLSRMPSVALPAPGPEWETAGAVVPLDDARGEASREWTDAMERWRSHRDSWERERSRSSSTTEPAPVPPSVPPGPVRATSALASAYLPGACVPRGARGEALPRFGTATEAETRLDDEDEGDDDTMMHAGPWTSGPVASEIIVWSVGTWDGVGALVARTCALSAQGLVTNGATAADAAEMDAALAFLHRVLTSAPSFAAKLATLDVSASTSPGSPATLLAALAAVVTGATAPGAAWSTLPCGRGEGSRRIDRGIERAALALAAAAPLAATAPIAALEELTAAPLLRAEEGMSDARGLAWGAAAALRGAGAASAGLATFERVVLPAEQSVGEYPLTLAFLRLLESLLWAGAGARSAMTPMLQHALNEILVQHGSWRFRRRADRWVIHAAVSRVLTAALAPRPGPENAARRAAVADFIAGDAGVTAAALASLALDASALRDMHLESSGRAAETAAVKDAVAETLCVIPSLVRVLLDSAATAAAAAGPGSGELTTGLGSGPLTRALLVEAPGGGPPLAAAVASYAAYPYAETCELALPALASLCEAAPADPPLACAIPALTPSSLSASTRAFELAKGGSSENVPDLDVRGAIAQALTPSVGLAGSPAKDRAVRAAAAFVAAAAARQPMLAESMLLPAKLSGDEDAPASALDALWACLGDAGEARRTNPRLLAAATGALGEVWRGGRLLAGATDALRAQPDFIARLEACLPAASDSDDDDDDEGAAHRFAVEADVFEILASEAAAAANGSAPAEGSVIAESIAKWCSNDASGGESALLRWFRRWTSPRRSPDILVAARLHAHAVVLLAGANAERAAIAKAAALSSGSSVGGVSSPPPLPDATLEENAKTAANALLSHVAAAGLLGGGAPRAAVLETVAAAAEAEAAGAPKRAPTDPVGRLLVATRELRLERAILAPPPPGTSLRRDVRAEYGGDFLYNATWVEAATGGARPRDAGVGDSATAMDISDEASFGNGEDDDARATRARPLLRPGRAAAEALRAAGRVASRASARLAALSAGITFVSVAAGSALAPPPMDDEDRGFVGGDVGSGPDLTDRENGSSRGADFIAAWPARERASAARAVITALEAALTASDEEGSEHTVAEAVELAHALEWTTRLWAKRLAGRDKSGSAAGGAFEVFEMARDVASAASAAVTRGTRCTSTSRAEVFARGDPMASITRPVLVAALVATRAWRRIAAASTSFLADGAELGQRLWPLVPTLCTAASTPRGGSDAALALAMLFEMSSGLVPLSALAKAVATEAPLPLLVPPRIPRTLPSRGAARQDLIPRRDGVSSVTSGDGVSSCGEGDGFDDGHARGGGAEVSAALKLSLALGRSPEGAAALHRAGLIDRLASLCVSLSGAPYLDADDDAFVHACRDEMEAGDGDGDARGSIDVVGEVMAPGALFCLALRVAATHADALGGDGNATSRDDEIVDRREALVNLSVQLGDRLEDALAPAELNVHVLAEAEATAGFLNALSAAAGETWQSVAPEGRARARAAAVAFLAWIASPPPSRRGIACAPRTASERAAAARAPLVGCSVGWFHACAVGSVPVGAPGSAALAAAVAASSSVPAGNAHSEAIAARLYAVAARCAAFLASFLRPDAAAMLGAEVIDSLSRQASSLSTELERRKALLGKEGGGGAGGAELNDALSNIARSLFQSATRLEMMEEGESAPDSPEVRLNSSFSLTTQMSWRATPARAA